ncbi:MAG: hypothetical protein JWQ35_153 [Bacteriovoracaceae bacterium]|nr:hypothetical protein [Bacteriovoracaceae bacterium]
MPFDFVRIHRSSLFFICALFFIGAVYLPSLRFDFVDKDDNFQIYDNPLVVGNTRNSSIVDNFHMTNTWTDFLLTPMTGYPTPLTILSYKADYLIGNLNPSFFHFTNLLIHLLCAIVIYFICLQIGLSPAASLVAMLFFSLHPICTETVAWITNRKTSLSTMFALFSIYQMIKISKQITKPYWHFSLALLFWVLACFSKPLAICLLPLILWTAVTAKELKPLRVSFIIGSFLFVFAILKLSTIGLSGRNALADQTSIWVWARECWYALGYHLELMFFLIRPENIHLPDARPPHFNFFTDTFPFFVAAAIGMFFVFRKNKIDKAWCWGAALLVLGIFPAVNIIRINRYLADTFCYLPICGLAILAGYVFEELKKIFSPSRIHQMIFFGLALMGLTFLTIGTLNASVKWQNGIALRQSIVDAYPNEPAFCSDLGSAYAIWNKWDQALQTLRECEKKFPGSRAFDLAMGSVLLKLGNTAEAKERLENAKRNGVTHPVLQYNLDLIQKINEQQ